MMAYIYFIYSDAQTDRQMERQTGRQINRPTDRQMLRLLGRRTHATGIKTDRRTSREPDSAVMAFAPSNTVLTRFFSLLYTVIL